MRNWTEDFLAHIIHADDLSRARQSMTDSAVIRDDEIHEMEARVRHADGSWRWLHFRTVIFRRTPQGEARLLLVAADDISAHKEAE